LIFYIPILAWRSNPRRLIVSALASAAVRIHATQGLSALVMAILGGSLPPLIPGWVTFYGTKSGTLPLGKKP
jgi:fucose permease